MVTWRALFRKFINPNTVSGYWWSVKKGAEAIIAEGTIISANIVTKE